jgi:thioredoxin-like negative regulator of GroEL
MLTPRDERLRLLAVLSVLALAAGARPAPAQQVQWCPDYNTARKEASEKGRPLLIDFGTENCFWCKKLDLTTFHDPAVVALLNEQFVALKVDAEREPSLTQSLRIQQYPTMVLAGPEGRILGVLEGYQEAPQLAEQLRKVAAGYFTPEWMARNYQEAAKAVLASDYSRAVGLLKSITQDGKDRSVQVKARQVLQDLEQQAAGRLARAKSLQDRGQSSEAAEVVTELLRSYAGTQAAADGAALLTTLAASPELSDQQRRRRARELLAQARDDYRTQQYLGCLERCELLTGGYSDLPESAEAQQLANEIKENPPLLARACDSLNQRMGAMYLSLAESWLKKGQPLQAQLCLEKVLQAAPGTRHAEQAQVQLARLHGAGATQQAEYKKP